MTTFQNTSPRFAFLICVALLSAGRLASAATLINGNFEAATNPDSASNTFPSWIESAGLAAIKAPTALIGTTSALLTGTSGTTGTLAQTVDPIVGSFDLTFSFASVDPGTAGTTNRALQLLLTGSNGAQINLIVIRGSSSSLGSVQVFGGSFQPIGSLVDKVNFSTALSSPVVNTLSLNGTPGGNYTITANGTTSGPVSFYQAGTGTTPTNFTTVSFTTVNATTANYVVDNVTLVPEPTSSALIAATGLLGLIRRRNRKA